MKKRSVIIGFLGTALDSGRGGGRWQKWRPTVSLAQAPNEPARIELLHTEKFTDLAAAVQSDIVELSENIAVNLHLVEQADPWDFSDVYTSLYDWVKAYEFKPRTEQYFAHITTGTHVAQICMFLMVESRLIPGALLQTAPPRRQKTGAIGSHTVIDLDLSRYDQIASRHKQDQRNAVAFLKSGIRTRNPRFNEMVTEIERIAIRSKAPVLLAGPTGAGKSFLARKMFELKQQRHHLTGQFVEVNCATLRGDGAASTLFGHKKGAFTGAGNDRAGLLRSASGGILFLDEIGELGLDEQAMLLKAIEEKRFYPVGADTEVSSNFQLLAGTNRDLRADVANGRFREDLFARINLWTFNLPGLNERTEDIEPNIEHLLTINAQEMGSAVRFNAEAKTRYLRFAKSPDAKWSGNFRDLSASITRLTTLADGGRITSALVDAEVTRLQWLWSQEAEHVTGTSDDLLSQLLSKRQLQEIDRFDQIQLAGVIAQCQHAASLSQAGRQLFDVSRQARSVVNDADRLRKYLARFGLTWQQVAGR